jgi:hypothetical protein
LREGNPLSPTQKKFSKNEKNFKKLLTNEKFCGIIIYVRERERSESLHKLKERKRKRK